MGYSIIFKTIIVLLSDGRLIHFSRDGCNNDDAGRKEDEFTARIYSRSEFEKCAKGFMENSTPFAKDSTGFDLKIGSRPATYYDYGAHLLRMLKRAKSYTDFLREYSVTVRYCTGIELLKPYRQFISCREFEDTWAELTRNYSQVISRRIVEYPSVSDEALIAKLIANNAPLEFSIRKRCV